MTYAVLLAGGWGERFWPKSRRRNPKQFLSIGSNESLIEASIRRISKCIPRKNLRIVTVKEQEKSFLKICPFLKKSQLFLEPFGRNTAAAVALAAFEIAKQDPDAVLLVFPCDQWIDKEKEFIKTLKQAEETARTFNGVVTVGVRPSYPATGYGYLCHSGKRETFGKGKGYRVTHFVEKPELPKARRLLKKGSVLWSIGIFAFRIPILMEALREHLPQLYRGFLRRETLQGIYRKIRPVSFDYGILERLDKIAVVTGDFIWSDLGSWRSLETVRAASEGNLLLGDAYIEEGKGNIFVSEKGHLLAGLGVSNLVVVHTSDVTLVCPKERAEEVKKLVHSVGRRFGRGHL